MCCNKLFHAANLGPIKSLHQEKLGGEELGTYATVAAKKNWEVRNLEHVTVACLCLTMLYKQGYYSRSVC